VRRKHVTPARARADALLKFTDENPPERVRPCNVQKLINPLKLRKTYEIDGIPNKCLRNF
jgi:hypothetical protein